MKANKIFSVTAIFAVALFMTFTACQKDDSATPGCSSFISASSSGFLNGDNCFSELVKFKYIDGKSIALTANQSGDTSYSCIVQVGTAENPFTGVGTYKCGDDQPGHVELIAQGTEKEIYKPVSGTINVTVFGSDIFIASFNVTLQGSSNRETLKLKGRVRY